MHALIIIILSKVHCNNIIIMQLTYSMYLKGAQNQYNTVYSQNLSEVYIITYIYIHYMSYILSTISGLQVAIGLCIYLTHSIDVQNNYEESTYIWSCMQAAAGYIYCIYRCGLFCWLKILLILHTEFEEH